MSNTHTARKVIDMNTAEGMGAHMATLPTENLREIAAREMFLNSFGGNVLMITAAAGELILRGEG
jgi:nitrous oxide reductase accessory protein NosL